MTPLGNSAQRTQFPKLFTRVNWEKPLLATNPRLLPLYKHLVRLCGAGTHDLRVFGREVVIVQQVVHQALSVADVSD